MSPLGHFLANSLRQSPVSVSCSYCGKEVSLLSRWLSADHRFCSVWRRRLYNQEYDRLAIQALEWNNPQPMPPSPTPLVLRQVATSKPDPPLPGISQFDSAVMIPRTVSPDSLPRVVEQRHGPTSEFGPAMLGFEGADAESAARHSQRKSGNESVLVDLHVLAQLESGPQEYEEGGRASRLRAMTIQRISMPVNAGMTTNMSVLDSLAPESGTFEEASPKPLAVSVSFRSALASGGVKTA